MAGTFFITTAIDYTNGAPHIGHAYEKVLADVIARYHRLKGDEVFFLTGVDQHGQKVQQSAEKAGIEPQQFVDEITAKFRALWEKLDVRYDAWAATTDERHKRCVQAILQRLWSEGQIYKDKRKGYYSVRQEQFLTDKERGLDGEFGAEWGEVVLLEEENYYFRLAQHKEWLLEFLQKSSNSAGGASSGFVTPAFRQSELINAVQKLTGDLCISRPKSRLTWGIELPFDHEFVTYVWFDALVNYISFVGYDPALSTLNSQLSTLTTRWPALHVIGKDILIPAHGIYWPIMLHALGFPDEQMPKLLVHGWWNIAGAKMSKTLGNVIDPDALADRYGAEALRYFLMKAIVSGRDADFDEEMLVQHYNFALANSLGNLLNRSLNMAQRYRGGTLNAAGKDRRFLAGDRAGTYPFGDLIELHVQLYRDSMDGFTIESYETRRPTDPYLVHSALACAFHNVEQSNGLIEVTAPWKLAKDTGDQAQSELDAVLYVLAESLRITAILLWPVLPRAANGIFDQLNWRTHLTDDTPEPRFRLADATWGGLPDGHILGKPTPLFPRIETLDAPR